jgi:serine/threonine-protein kinase RsbW
VRAAVTDAELLDGDVKFRLVLPREPVSVPVMRRVLGGTLLSFGANPESVADLLLAATEACTNVLRHGERAEEYQVYASVSHGDCLLEIANGTVAGGAPRSRANGPPGRRAAGHAGSRAGQQASERPEARAAGQTPAPVAAPSPGEVLDIARIPESGRGLTIMRACVDDLTLRGSPERGTVVSMRKRIAWADGAPGHGPGLVNGRGAAGHHRPGAAA